jgi:Flp pilus assembly protein TadD
LSLQGKAAESLPFLRKAVEVQPQSREAHLFLGDALEQAGDVAAAQREREKAQAAGSTPHQ